MFVAGLTRQLRTPPCQWVATFPPPKIPVYIDNQAAIVIMSKQTRGRNRHMDIRLKFLQNSMHTEQFDFVYIPSADNDTDIGTKVLALPIFRKLRERVTGTRIDHKVLAMIEARHEFARTAKRSDVRRSDEHGGVSEHPSKYKHSQLNSPSIHHRIPSSVEVAEAYTHAPVDSHEQQYKVRDQEVAKAIKSYANRSNGTDRTRSTRTADYDGYDEHTYR